MEKKLLIGSLLTIIFLISGCAISNYLSGDTSNKSYSLLTEQDKLNEQKNNEDNIDELDKLINETDVNENETQNVVEETDNTPTEEDTEVVNEETNNTVVEEENVDEGSFLKLTVKENEKVRLRPKAVDVNNDTIKYTFSEPLDANGEWQTNYGDAGNYLITVTATDGTLTTSKKVLLTVERVNVPPVIEGVQDEITVSEGDILSLEPKVSDPNGDQVTVKISEPIGDSGTWEIGYQDNGKYNVTIAASDGELETVKKIKLTVNRKNVPPAIEDLSDITVNEGDAVNVEPVVTDLNGDKLTINISQPVGNSGEWQTGYTDRGTYTITVTASDGTAVTSKSFNLIVSPVNKAPEINDIVLG